MKGDSVMLMACEGLVHIDEPNLLDQCRTGHISTYTNSLAFGIGCGSTGGWPHGVQVSGSVTVGCVCS